MEQIKEFPLKDIVISDDFKNTIPAEQKMQKKIECFNRTGKLPGVIVINDENVLIDGYISYLIATECGFTQVPVIRGYAEIIEVQYGSRRKTYFWKVPIRLRGKVKKGDKCLVRNNNGVKWVRVSNVIQMQYPIQEPILKYVLSCYRHNHKVQFAE